MCIRDRHHGDVHALVLGAGLNDDVDVVLVLFGDDIDVGGGVSGGLLAVGPDIVGPFGHFVQISYLPVSYTHLVYNGLC